MLEQIQDWPSYLAMEGSGATLDGIREHTRTGRPMGDDIFLDTLEHLTGQCLRKGKPGPKVAN